MDATQEEIIVPETEQEVIPKIEVPLTYKEKQARAKQRMCRVMPAPKNEHDAIFIDPESNNIYEWTKTGNRKVGFRVGGQNLSMEREPANKKEWRKKREGKPYRDKKGKVALDEIPLDIPNS